jgi:hypothetical protein
VNIDKRPNLLDLKPKEFEAFIQNLFAKMGFDTASISDATKSPYSITSRCLV